MSAVAPSPFVANFTPTLVQSAKSTFVQNATKVTVALPGRSISGDCIIVNIYSFSVSPISSVTDNVTRIRSVINPSGTGNVYNLVQQSITADGVMAVYIANNIMIPPSGVISVSVIVSALVSSVEILEYSNI